MAEYIVNLTGVAVKPMSEADICAQLTGLPVLEEVVRCRDCEYFTPNKEFWIDPPKVPFPIIGATADVCEFWAGTECKVDPNGFCSNGRRRRDYA